MYEDTLFSSEISFISSPDFSPAFETKPIVAKTVGDGEDVAKLPR